MKRTLNFAAKLIFGLVGLLLIPTANGQGNTNVNEVILTGTLPPAPPQINTSVLGVPGASVRCYFIVANYPTGSVVNAQFPSCVTNANNTLTGSNFVNIGWTAVTSPTTTAVTYDVIVQTQQGPFPVSGSCISCAVATGLTANTTTDTGGALTNYTFVGFATPNPTARLHINNDAFATPQVVLSNWPFRVAQGDLYLGNGAKTTSGTLHQIGLITDTTDDPILGFTAAAGVAIDYFNITNAATGGTPIFGIGSTTDANVPIKFLTKGTGQYTFATGGGTQFAITDTPTAVNNFVLSGFGAGGGPTLTVQGADSAIPINIASKSTAGINFLTNAATQFSIANGAGTVINRYSVSGSATNTAPVFGIGSTTDANVGMQFSPKGTGQFFVLPTTAGGATAAFNVIPAASYVNGVVVNATATGVNPSIASQGGDANAGLVLSCVGTCAVQSGAGNPLLSNWQNNTQTGAVTMPAAQMVNGIIVGTPVAGVNYQSATAANLCIQMSRGTSGVTAGISADLFIKNTSGGANTITVTTNTGITLSGTVTIAQNNFRQFKMVATNCTAASEAVTIFALASGAF